MVGKPSEVIYVLRKMNPIIGKFYFQDCYLYRAVSLMCPPLYIHYSSIHHLLIVTGMFLKGRYPRNMEGLRKFPLPFITPLSFLCNMLLFYF